MEIENNGLAAKNARAAAQGTTQRETSDTRPQQAANSALPSDTVSLTPIAQKLQQLEASVAAEPVVNLQRVNTVRDAINDGSFQINPDRIASQLIDLEQAFARAG